MTIEKIDYIFQNNNLKFLTKFEVRWLLVNLTDNKKEIETFG